jgi:hypothetical protein
MKKLPKEFSNPYQEHVVNILPDEPSEAFEVMAAFIANMLLSMSKSPETFIEIVNEYMSEYSKEDSN